jgi:catechol 2,3-dioxygenase-like lactoylglutathione lyase family enzyme
MIDGISAVTLGAHEMQRAVRFYRALRFEVLHGGDESSFISFRAGTSYLKLIAQSAERRWSWWGRVIFYVADVDALYDRALAAGCQPTTVPRDAEWGERYFHLIDPDGHELSFARPLRSSRIAAECSKSIASIFIRELRSCLDGRIRHVR